MDNEMPTLFVLMRTDMESMNPGKAMAQACHAANQMVHGTQPKIGAENYCPLISMREEWERQADGFGTTIVLDGKNIDNIRNILNKIQADGWDQVDYSFGVVHDPTYPIRDGEVTHLIPIDTCGWVFCRRGSRYHKRLEGLELHP